MSDNTSTFADLLDDDTSDDAPMTLEPAVDLNDLPGEVDVRPAELVDLDYGEMEEGD